MAKKIYLSPSDQDNNAYAFGNTTENAQCCRIADACEKALKRCGFEVKNNQTSSMEGRVAESNTWGADLHIPIHTNAFNGNVGGTRMFYYSETSKGKDACKKIFDRLAPVTPGTSENIKSYPELYELRKTTGIAVYIEVDFHDVPSIAKWIIEHPTEIGESIAHGVCDYFGVEFKENKESKVETASSDSTANNTVSVSLPILRKGANNGYVKTLQILLNKYNNAGLVEDGSFGDKTNTALYSYQKSRNLTVDGAVGEETWTQLLK